VCITWPCPPLAHQLDHSLGGKEAGHWVGGGGLISDWNQQCWRGRGVGYLGTWREGGAQGTDKLPGSGERVIHICSPSTALLTSLNNNHLGTGTGPPSSLRAFVPGCPRVHVSMQTQCAAVLCEEE
jgi:hypothetical protein